jgi:hypothetical protein
MASINLTESQDLDMSMADITKESKESRYSSVDSLESNNSSNPAASTLSLQAEARKVTQRPMGIPQKPSTAGSPSNRPHRLTISSSSQLAGKKEEESARSVHTGSKRESGLKSKRVSVNSIASVESLSPNFKGSKDTLDSASSTAIFPRLFKSLQSALKSPRHAISSSLTGSKADMLASTSELPSPATTGYTVCRICEKSLLTEELDAHSNVCALDTETDLKLDEIDVQLGDIRLDLEENYEKQTVFFQLICLKLATNQGVGAN